MFTETNPPRTILICCLRLMGDVLVTTPLAHSISNAFPGAAIDYLVFEGTGGILAKHPLVRNVIAIPKKGGGATVRSLFRKYDLAVAAYPSDRTAMAAAMAGRRSVGLIYREKKGWWKRLLLDRTCFCDDRLHVGWAMTSLAHELGIPAVAKVSVGYDDGDAAYARERLPAGRYVLLHPYSMNRFKYWPQEQWQRLASLIQERTGCTAVFTVPSGATITDVIDLHTFRPQELPDLLEDYLGECVRLGFRSVRIIHGKGSGTQKRRVQAMLRRNPLVRGFTDAPPEAGGWGATVVELKVDPRTRPRS